MCLIKKTSTTVDSEGGAPLTSLGRGLTTLTLAQHDSMVDAMERFRPAAVATSITSENASSLGSGLMAGKDFTERPNRNLAVGDGHVWIGQTKNKNHTIGNAYTGYDSHGIGHTRYQSPSTAASSEIPDDTHSAKSPGYSVSVHIYTHLILPDLMLVVFKGQIPQTIEKLQYLDVENRDQVGE